MLRMLGEIEFAEWQCIAELIDNAFDDFTETWSADGLWPGGYKVSVSLPGHTADAKDAEVVVSDTGRGMSREQLQRAVKAGFSSNDRFEKLGLFGMGFNVSTARLGGVTTVMTTRDGDAEWIGVTIDFETLGPDFEAPEVTRPKKDLSEHGTRVTVGHLRREQAEWLKRNPENLRRTLGRIYGWILDNRPFELWVQGVQVVPRRACRWGDNRHVMYGSGASAEQIPAYIPIDQSFQPADACDQCGNWQDVGKGQCDQCGSNDVKQRERRIHGWLGIQRHLDKRDFGIDFIRNGRKILQFDKRLFDWSNPNDPIEASEAEYPIELNQGGRIIGEIHLDHVPVTYQKNAFDYGDRSWKAAVEYLRGSGPLRPQKAKATGYPENTSFLGQLFKGYRRTDPGLRCLIPGDGKGPIHDETRRWAQEFWAGKPDYQSDEIWYEAVLSHEERALRLKERTAVGANPSDPDELAVLRALGVTERSRDASSQDTPESSESETNVKETLQERLDRYRRDGAPLPELSREYGLPELGNLRVDAVAVSKTIVQDAENQRTPVYLAPGAGATATCFIDVNHSSFTKFGSDYGSLLLVEVATYLKLRTVHVTLTTSEIVSRLESACFPDSAIEIGVISARARELLTDVRQRMAERVDADPQRALQFLTPDEMDYTENGVIADGGSTTDLVRSGQFLMYVPPLFLVKLLEGWPDAFMDGNVFVGVYESLTSPSSQRLSLARVVGYLNDVAMLVSFQATLGTLQLQRTRLSMQLLSGELAPD
jgi:hypothetical protein